MGVEGDTMHASLFSCSLALVVLLRKLRELLRDQTWSNSCFRAMLRCAKAWNGWEAVKALHVWGPGSIKLKSSLNLVPVPSRR